MASRDTSSGVSLYNSIANMSVPWAHWNTCLGEDMPVERKASHHGCQSISFFEEAEIVNDSEYFIGEEFGEVFALEYCTSKAVHVIGTCYL